MLVVYGCIVMYSPGVTCDNLKHTGLWVWVGITLHKQVIVLLYALGVFVYLNYILPLGKTTFFIFITTIVFVTNLNVKK